MGIISSLISSVGGAIVGNRQQNKEMAYNSREAQKNRDFQTQERIAAQQYNTEMWEKNNEYNSIGSQIERAVAAGVNPNYLLDSGYSSAQSNAPTTSPMSGNAASYSSSLSSALLGSFSQNVLALSQAEKNESETDLNKYNLTWNKMTEKERYDALINMNDKTRAEIAKIFSDIGINNFNKELQEKTFTWFASKSEAEIKVMTEQLNLLRNQSLDILKGIDLKDAQIQDLFAGAKLKSAQTVKTYSDIAVNQQNIKESEQRVNQSIAEQDLTEQQTEGQKINNAIQTVIKNFSEATKIPLGASESQALFALWKEGRFEEFSNKCMINSANSQGGSIYDNLARSMHRLNFGGQQLWNDIKSFWTK